MGHAKTVIYLDNQSTTRVDPRVVAVMSPFFSQHYGNPSSNSHALGWEAKEAVDQSRQVIADGLRVDSREICFTSGATESNNLALRGVLRRKRNRGRHVITLATEHKAVLDPLRSMHQAGECDLTILPVQTQDADLPGLVDLDQLRDSIRDDTVLVSVMLVNNEMGAIQPLAEISELCHERGVWVHSDATQALGKIPLNLKELGIDLASFSAHKLYGPKGTGCLYVRKGSPAIRLQPILEGGGQEFGLRSGTLNSPGIVGFADAVRLSIVELSDEWDRICSLQLRFWTKLQQVVPDVLLNGPPLPNQADAAHRIPHNLNVAFRWVDGETLMLNMPRLAVSSGSACNSTNPQPSHVLQALGVDDDLVRGSLRFGFGRFNQEWEMDDAVDMLAENVAKLRKSSSMS
ncbi:MAG: cysteine desulfurase family protein [Pirellulaceae bacterium]